MVAEVVGHHAQSNHIRPFVPYRDMNSLATLIQRSFGPELSATGSYIVQDLRQMAMLGPLLRATGSIIAPFIGFVWVEGGTLVGNVSLAPEKGDERTWTVSNVAVLPEHRGRGIAGRLVDRAIACAERRGVERLQLQVRTDNAAALALYAHRGFTVLDTVHEMQRTRSDRGSTQRRTPDGVAPLRFADRAAAAHLVASTASPATLSPSVYRRLRRGYLGWLGEQIATFLNVEHYVEAAVRNGDDIVAYGYAAPNTLRGPHEMGVYVHPEHRGNWEVPVMGWLLRRLRRTISQPVRTVISAEHVEALAAAEELGFRTLRVLNHMVLDLRPGHRHRR